MPATDRRASAPPPEGAGARLTHHQAEEATVTTTTPAPPVRIGLADLGQIVDLAHMAGLTINLRDLGGNGLIRLDFPHADEADALNDLIARYSGADEFGPGWAPVDDGPTPQTGRLLPVEDLDGLYDVLADAARVERALGWQKPSLLDRVAEIAGTVMFFAPAAALVWLAVPHGAVLAVQTSTVATTGIAGFIAASWLWWAATTLAEQSHRDQAHAHLGIPARGSWLVRTRVSAVALAVNLALTGWGLRDGHLDRLALVGIALALVSICLSEPGYRVARQAFRRLTATGRVRGFTAWATRANESTRVQGRPARTNPTRTGENPDDAGAANPAVLTAVAVALLALGLIFGAGPLLAAGGVATAVLAAAAGAVAAATLGATWRYRTTGRVAPWAVIVGAARGAAYRFATGATPAPTTSEEIR